MELRQPDRTMLSSYVDALERGWSPRNVDSEAARLATLARIDADSEAFLAEFEDGKNDGPPVVLPDGTTVPRLPDLMRWMWDCEFCGHINLRWQPGTSALPPHVLGHVGYSTVEWKCSRGYATQALKGILPFAKERGLEQLEISASADNVASWHVIEKAGGRHARDMTGVIHHHPDETVRLYIIRL